MKPDYNINDYYYMFINQAKQNIPVYKEKYETAYAILLDCKNNLVKNVGELYDLGIKLLEYPIEWGMTKYNSEELLFKKAHKMLKELDAGPKKVLVLQVVKYCGLLKHCNRHINNYEIAKNTSSLTFKEFKALVNKFYGYGVHKAILDGYAYAYGYGIGDLMISRWTTGKPKMIIDFAATAAKKKELLAAGKELYDARKAAWYQARGIKYEVEDYRVYRQDNFYYEIDIVNSKILHRSKQEFKTTEYIAVPLRGKSQEEVASQCNSREEILNLKVDIKYKLNAMLFKYPTDYLKYIRNAEQDKYKRGAHNSKNRQRL